MPAKLTKEKFIDKAKLVHNNKYDYSNTEYISSHKKISILCPLHGVFEQSPTNHLSGFGCKKCGVDSASCLISSNSEKFIDKAKIVHNNKYDYSNISYKSAKTKIMIICPEHGIFSQTPDSHLRGRGCSKCANIEKKNKLLSNVIKFTVQSNKIHNNFYSYEKSSYVNSRTKLIIICPLHGEFEQTPNKHLSGHGCSTCRNNGSSTLNKIDNILSFEKEFTFNNCVNIRKLPFDRYNKENNILLEFDGEQHFRYKSFWHKSVEVFEEQKLRDEIKTAFAIENGFNFIRISYEEDAEKSLTDFLNFVKMNPHKQIIQIYGEIHFK